MFPVGADDARVRVLAGRDRGLARERIGVEHPDLVIGFVADVDLPRGRMHRETGEKHRGGLRTVSGGDRRQLRRIHGVRQRGFAVSVIEHVHESAVAARDENPAAVAAEDDAVPTFLQREELGDLLRFEVEQREPRIAEAPAHGDEHLLVGRHDHLERHVAHAHVAAGRRDTPPVEQQRRTGQQAGAFADRGTVDILFRSAGDRRGGREAERRGQGGDECSGEARPAEG